MYAGACQCCSSQTKDKLLRSCVMRINLMSGKHSFLSKNDTRTFLLPQPWRHKSKPFFFFKKTFELNSGWFQQLSAMINCSHRCNIPIQQEGSTWDTSFTFQRFSLQVWNVLQNMLKRQMSTYGKKWTWAPAQIKSPGLRQQTASVQSGQIISSMKIHTHTHKRQFSKYMASYLKAIRPDW